MKDILQVLQMNAALSAAAFLADAALSSGLLPSFLAFLSLAAWAFWTLEPFPILLLWFES
jgi:hypothetical protein